MIYQAAQRKVAYMMAQASKGVVMFDEVDAGSALCTRRGCCEQRLHHTSEPGLCDLHTDRLL